MLIHPLTVEGDVPSILFTTSWDLTLAGAIAGVFNSCDDTANHATRSVSQSCRFAGGTVTLVDCGAGRQRDTVTELSFSVGWGLFSPLVRLVDGDGFYLFCRDSYCLSKSFKFFNTNFSIFSQKTKLSSFRNAKQLLLLDSFNFEIKLIPSTTKALTRENYHHRSANWMQTQSLAFSIFPGINNIQQPGILYCCSLAIVVGTSVTFALDGFN